MREDMLPSRLLTRREVCELLQISPASLERRRKEGLRSVYVGGSVRYRVEHILAYVEASTTEDRDL